MPKGLPNVSAPIPHAAKAVANLSLPIRHAANAPPKLFPTFRDTGNGDKNAWPPLPRTPSGGRKLPHRAGHVTNANRNLPGAIRHAGSARRKDRQSFHSGGNPLGILPGRCRPGKPHLPSIPARPDSTPHPSPGPSAFPPRGIALAIPRPPATLPPMNASPSRCLPFPPTPPAPAAGPDISSRLLKFPARAGRQKACKTAVLKFSNSILKPTSSSATSHAPSRIESQL